MSSWLVGKRIDPPSAASGLAKNKSRRSRHRRPWAHSLRQQDTSSAQTDHSYRGLRSILRRIPKARNSVSRSPTLASSLTIPWGSENPKSASVHRSHDPRCSRGLGAYDTRSLGGSALAGIRISSVDLTRGAIDADLDHIPLRSTPHQVAPLG